jgi:hypothetical protein
MRSDVSSGTSDSQCNKIPVQVENSTYTLLNQSAHQVISFSKLFVLVISFLSDFCFFKLKNFSYLWSYHKH